MAGSGGPSSSPPTPPGQAAGPSPAMEQYEVLEQLQPGALGTMLVAKLKAEKDEEKYMIKKVECIDEKQANEALKEAMELLKLNHPRICAYMELFITWDNEISSLFLCLVMQHSGTGDLSSLIEEKRQKREKINYMVMMRFLGHVVDALFYVHKQGIFHGDLIDDPLIRECLTITGASSINLKKTLSPQIMDLLLEGEYRIILVFMKVFWDVEEAQAKAIQKIASFLGDRSALLSLLVFTEFIVFAMKTHIDSLRIQVEGCSLLLAILSQALEENALVTLEEKVASCLLGILRRHSENEEIVSLICTLLMIISASESAAETLRQVELIPELLPVLRNFLHNEQICLSCCGVIWSLAASENNVDQEVLASAVPVISAVLQEHLQNGTVAECACSALWGLSLQGCLTDNDYEPTTALLLAALRMNTERCMVVKNTCLALASLLRLSEIPALKLLTDSKGSGINLIKDAYQLHFDDPRVVNSICVLLNEMVQYEDVVLDMLYQKMEDLLFEIKLRFPSSTEIMTLVDATLLKLEEKLRV
ncbi:serine/threonine kinase-like domain-containing protein STKLD1 isoform X4 [Apus apus]|uniref:serine/threonine kinase-like domain-containing protein STKLD1 isoform X4 n=1 Tax=Apus apus TaxID=8895 RepID=UPI0021F85C9C|nr:serine/threonine kinase-like domain-containing protein STKLD1 isoform X4 [Apus apus]